MGKKIKYSKFNPPPELKHDLELVDAAAQLSLACEGLLQWSRDNGGCEYVDDCPRWIEDSYRVLASRGIDPAFVVCGYLDVLVEAKKAWERQPDNGKLVTLAQLKKRYPIVKPKARPKKEAVEELLDWAIREMELDLAAGFADDPKDLQKKIETAKALLLSNGEVGA